MSGLVEMLQFEDDNRAEHFGYGPKEFALITALLFDVPDLYKAEELIISGADINARGDRTDLNILAEIIRGRMRNGDFKESSPCGTQNEDSAPVIVCIVRFFLEHGFDVSLDSDRYGAQCLFWLELAAFDESALQAIKLLLSAGARNVVIDDDAQPDENPIDNAASTFRLAVGAGKYPGAFVSYAIHRVLQAHENGEPYMDIRTFYSFIGKLITAVKIPNGSDPYSILYICSGDDCLFIASNAIVYVRSCSDCQDLLDVSDDFRDVIGQNVTDIQFIAPDGDGLLPVIQLHLGSSKILELEIGKVSIKDSKIDCQHFYNR